jgi:hypothetical protein
MEEVLQVHAEEDEERPWVQVVQVIDEVVDDKQQNVRRKNAKEAAAIKRYEVAGTIALTYLLSLKQDAGDEEAAEDEKDVDPNPAEWNPETVIDEDSEESHGTKTIELRDASVDGG